jgi:hypothetical protein
VVLEVSYVLDDGRVDFREDLGRHRDQDRRGLLHHRLAEPRLVQVGLEQEEHQQHLGHQGHICQIQHHREKGLEDCLPARHVLEVELVRLKVSLEGTLELDPSQLVVQYLGDSVLLGQGAFLVLPAFDEVGGPQQIDEDPDEDERVVETGPGARADGLDVAVLEPEENLNDEGRQDQGPGPQCQKLDEGEVEGYLLAAVGTDAARLEGLELEELELQLFLDTQLGEVRNSQLALVL